MSSKTLAFIHRNDTRFAVGDFSPVLSVFSHLELGNTISPFLLLDHIGPGKLRPSNKQQGVHRHPHRGFETVTIVYAGELEHQDSSGAGGLIRAGEVQWMTAASGIIHQELFSKEFTRTGGAFEMIQLWVNLPAASKMGPARYQSLRSSDIPVVTLPDIAGTVRVIAGKYNNVTGAAQTHTRMSVLDVRLNAGHPINFSIPEGDTTLVYVCSGRLQIHADEWLEENAMAVMSSQGTDFMLTASENSKLLILAGEPINEPINGHGPFVMNSYEEILQAYDDVKHGRLVQS
ncbi:pirin family protein [Alkanindiges illinoisensis]|uniref:pirin family protein n=1 Tax=Alkanindiges illinoisensis TaxID=197183 RepID=UPI000479656D|nr:pirin family protein [Alkanindiges illinoisensis]